MITTTDNPFDPFTEYDQWSDYDERQGYFTNQYLARLVTEKMNARTSEADADMLAMDAMDEMVEVGLYPYQIVYPTSETDTATS